MAETAQAFETNTAQLELTPTQRFASPLYAAGLSLRESVNNATQFLGDALGSTRDQASAMFAVATETISKAPGHLKEEILKHRTPTTALLATGAVLMAPAVGIAARSKAAQTPVTPVTPATKYHYMRLGSQEFKKTLKGYVKECPEGLTVTPTHMHQSKPRVGLLRMSFIKEEKTFVKATLKKSEGAKLCGALALTADGKYAFKPKFVKGVFVDPNPGGTSRVSKEVVAYLKKAPS